MRLQYSERMFNSTVAAPPHKILNMPLLEPVLRQDGKSSSSTFFVTCGPIAALFFRWDGEKMINAPRKVFRLAK